MPDDARKQARRRARKVRKQHRSASKRAKYGPRRKPAPVVTSFVATTAVEDELEAAMDAALGRD